MCVVLKEKYDYARGGQTRRRVAIKWWASAVTASVVRMRCRDRGGTQKLSGTARLTPIAEDGEQSKSLAPPPSLKSLL